MIRIVNFLLTRRCNLKCDYCAITRNYKNMPADYPHIDYYLKNEISTNDVITALTNLKKHNPKVFVIFYGGEPLLREDLPDIINFANKSNIYYTIISNNTDEIQPLVRRLFKKVDYIRGFTSSVDPTCMDKNFSNSDRIRKSIDGFKRLKEIKASGKVKDVVAEVTVMPDNQHLLYNLVKELSSVGIYSSITFIDIAKTPYYDFSNIKSKKSLVQPSYELAESLSKMIKDDDILVHMKDVLLPWLFNRLPSNFNCNLELGIHNITIDADGHMRLCLRIRGKSVPEFHVNEIFYNKNISSHFYNVMCIDKQNYCQLCNHSCLMMSEYIETHTNKESELIHSY